MGNWTSLLIGNIAWNLLDITIKWKHCLRLGIINSPNWVYFLKLFLKKHFNQQKMHLKIQLTKTIDFIWCFESFKVKKMEIRLKTLLLTAEIHCMYSHFIRYTFRQEGDVFHNDFIYPYHILSRVPQAHHCESKCLMPAPSVIQSFSIY